MKYYDVEKLREVLTSLLNALETTPPDNIAIQEYSYKDEDRKMEITITYQFKED